MRAQMPGLLLLLFCALPLTASAYGGAELQEDCRAAEIELTAPPGTDVQPSLKSSRCLAYLEGFLDGYGVADRLAGKVGVSINAFCAPREPEARVRLVRALLAYLDRQPPFTAGNTMPAATALGAAFSKAFVCKG